MQQQESPPPTSIFCAAAPSDTRFLAQWERHLLPLIQAGQITVWSEQYLMAGETRLQQINDYLDHAHVIVFLLTAEFFASDECMALMERALKDEAHVIPLLLRPADWKTSKLADLACLPANGQFVTTWDNLDSAFQTCVDDLRQLLGLPAVQTQTRKSARVLALENQNRERMLRRLRRTYSDLMNQSLQGAAWLELGITSKPDAVQNAANLLLRVESRTEQPLPPGTSITEAYDEAEHELLILGEPGAGKSTLLLDLAQQLVTRAEHDETHPLPVILPLSSWAVKRPPLQDWITEQLAEIYDVPRKLSAQWVQEDSLLPLLDGLDEMEETARSAGIAAINAYHREHLMPLVVCSRKMEYEAASERCRLALQGAVVVQPLTHEGVDTSLVLAGESLTALHSTLKKNAALRELVTTPLMLNVLILTYQGTSVLSLPNRESILLQQVWDDYVMRMIARKGNGEHYPLSQTRAWLGWLARQMREHNQTVFYLERLQPDWLPEKRRISYLFSFWLVGWLVTGGIIGLISGLLYGPATGLFCGLFFGFILGGLFMLFLGNREKIEPVEILTWSWERMRSAPLIFGLLFGLILGLVDWSIAGILGLIIGLIRGSIIGLGFGLGFRVASGFSRKQLTERPNFSPNEGIRSSVKNGLRVGLIVGLVAGLTAYPFFGLQVGLISGIIVGPLFGLLSWLAFGLGAAIQHSILRFWLSRFRTFPWKAPQFLDDATARFLLRRVGGGYSFSHRLLLDHFADAETGATSSPNAS